MKDIADIPHDSDDINVEVTTSEEEAKLRLLFATKLVNPDNPCSRELAHKSMTLLAQTLH